jgi:hypothetical protein
MSSYRAIGRAALLAGASGLVWLGILASAQSSHADVPAAPAGSVTVPAVSVSR